MHTARRFISHNEKQTVKFGEQIAAICKAGYRIFLFGDLGSGKTVLVKGIARGLSIRRVITSPTFTIINEYKGTLPLYHIDLYRLHVSDVTSLGLDDYLWGDGVSVVEWAERLPAEEFPAHVYIRLKRSGVCTRRIDIIDHTDVIKRRRKRR